MVARKNSSHSDLTVHLSITLCVCVFVFLCQAMSKKSACTAQAISAIVHFMLLEHLGLIADDGGLTATVQPS